MAKVGRPAKGPLVNKREVLSFRVTSETKSRLAAEAAAAGRSIAQEAELRLRHGFNQEELILRAFGSEQLYGLTRVMALAMHQVGNTAGFSSTFTPEGSKMWFTDPYAYDQAKQAAIRVLEAFRPAGAPANPAGNRGIPLLEEMAPMLGVGFANRFLHLVLSDNPLMTRDMEQRDIIRRWLGQQLIEQLSHNVALGSVTPVIATGDRGARPKRKARQSRQDDVLQTRPKKGKNQ